MQFSLKTFSIALAGFVAVASALPQLRPRDGDSIQAVQAGCSLDKAVMPTIQEDGSNTQLSASATRVPKRVVIGRGTQNYTCSESTAAAIPAAYGAYAQLYDASCLAQNHPDVLHALPGMLLSMDTEKVRSLLGLCSVLGHRVEVGLHFFRDATTPVFEFRKSRSKDIFVGRRVESVAAPSDAEPGHYGAVDWLKLTAIEGSRGFSQVYRVNTAGGKAPRTCEGMPATFEVPYATEYWFY